MSDPIRVGLIGCGSNGQIHADGLAKLIQDGLMVPVLAADPSEEGRNAANRNCRFERLTTDPKEVLVDPSIDAVMICTPTNHHATYVKAAIDAGKAVMCEKPLCPTFSDVKSLCGYVSSCAPTARVAFQSRFHPMFRFLADKVASGDWGAPMGYVLRDDQYFPSGEFVEGHSSWRADVSQAGGGALLEHSIHAVDILLWTFGPVKKVYANTRHAFGFGVEDTCVVSIEHESGVVGSLITIFNAVVGRELRRLEVFCEQASVEVTSDFIVGAPEDSMLVQQPNKPAEYLDLGALREKSFGDLGIKRRDFLFYQYIADRAWLRSIQGKSEVGPTFLDAFCAHAVVEAAYRSAATGQPVDLIGELFAP